MSLIDGTAAAPNSLADLAKAYDTKALLTCHLPVHIIKQIIPILEGDAATLRFAGNLEESLVVQQTMVAVIQEQVRVQEALKPKTTRTKTTKKTATPRKAKTKTQTPPKKTNVPDPSLALNPA